ncbi:putative staphylococcal protein [Staphylococcus aureus]|uniref:hypothetical protein n=1 Tax=Staphylococcus aureus TaxID=1280 RepID=UPI0006B51BD6|nr:hypothetical protein [Staphylococcus aureus]CUE31978.1 putative staphylococcal protein [Staphylococcus aureus]
MDYAHLNLEHFFARNDDLDVIRDRADFVMINNFTNEMMYRDGQIEGTIDLNQYYYKNTFYFYTIIRTLSKKETK